MLVRATLASLLAALVLAVGCEKKPAEGGETKAAASQPANAASQPATPPAAEERGVHFVFPHDGSKIFETSTVVFGVKGMTVTPAGQDIEDKTKGHHHLIIDGQPIEKGKPVPTDERHIHFGKGQTSTTAKLTPGKHTLTLQFADGAHLSYGPELAKTITVEVVPDPPAKKVFFVEPQDGAKVKSPVKVKFGVEGFSLRPAGEDLLDKTSGHHHLIIDGAPIPAGQVVPADEKHIHYGKAQTEAEVELPPGKHTLTMQLADGAHISYGPELSATITVEVEDGGKVSGE